MAVLLYILPFCIGEQDLVEYRWETKWYRCRVASVTPGEITQERVVDLEFLPRAFRDARKSRGRACLKDQVKQLFLDGDIAVPGFHLKCD